MPGEFTLTVDVRVTGVPSVTGEDTLVDSVTDTVAAFTVIVTDPLLVLLCQTAVGEAPQQAGV
jgi:hypothetical protein